MQQRMDRRAWLAKMGLTSLGAGGLMLTLRNGLRVGAVRAGVPSANAVRVDLGFVSAYVLVRGNAAAIIDTGVAGSIDRIESSLLATGLGWGDVQHLILTHQHADHQGSAPDVLARAPQAAVWTGPADVPAITVPKTVNGAADGAEIFGLRVVATPGHTAGHIALFEPSIGTLFVGDAAFNNNDALTAVNPMFTADPATAIASFRKMAAIQGFETAMFGHGNPIEGGAAAAFARLAQTL